MSNEGDFLSGMISQHLPVQRPTFPRQIIRSSRIHLDKIQAALDDRIYLEDVVLCHDEHHTPAVHDSFQVLLRFCSHIVYLIQHQVMKPAIFKGHQLRLVSVLLKDAGGWLRAPVGDAVSM
jgi:hypothetical protein